MPLNWNPKKQLPDLSGKVIFVTGGTAGVGAASVICLAEHHPEKIYFTGRDERRANEVIARAKKVTESANIVFVKVDLASLDSVEAAFQHFDSIRLDILICNAGIMATPPALTKDGYEMQFGVNYLAHALFVKLFLPLLLETAKLPDSDVRVVMMTSLGYRMAPKSGVDFKNVKTTQDTGPGAPWMRYGQSKTADLLLAQELAKRYPQITSTSIHPGVVKTGLVSNLSFGAKTVVHVGCFVQGIKMIESDEGCYNMLWAAAGDKTGIVNGQLYEPVGVLSKTKNAIASTLDIAIGFLRRAFSTTQYTASELTTNVTNGLDQVQKVFLGMMEAMLRMEVTVGSALVMGLCMVWRFYFSMTGRFHRHIEKQHQRYGTVFRVSPNELSFASVDSWREIYGQKKPGQEQLPKSEFYDMYGSGFKTACVGSERDPKTHACKKKNLTAAFSTKALLEQESLVQDCIDGFVVKIGRLGKREGGVDMTAWYEMIAFDVLGEMAFGVGFGCIENGKFFLRVREEPHFWIDLILKHLLAITLVDNLRRWPLMATLGKIVLPRATTNVRDKHSNFSRSQVKRRLESQSLRKDFLTNIVGHVKSGEVSQEEMTAHSSTLIIAGGETTATFLAAVTYYLLQTPHAYRKLQTEICERYTSITDITAASALQLPYLQAVIHEGLRMYPPGSQGFPRISPGTSIDGHWVPRGTEVYTSAWTITHSPEYFHAPMAFKPERWLDASCTDVKEASQPFSLGTRGCLGRNFAFVEMSLTLSKLFLAYDLELVDKGLDWEGGSHMHVMWWKPHLMVRIRERGSGGAAAEA